MATPLAAGSSAPEGAAATAVSGDLANGLSSIVETLKNQALSLLGGSLAGGVVGHQVSQRSNNEDKEGLKEELGEALPQLGQIDQLQEQLLVAEAKTSQLQAELSTLSAATSRALLEAAQAAVEAAKAATEASKAAREVSKVAAENAKPPAEEGQEPAEEVPPPMKKVESLAEEGEQPAEEGPPPVEEAAAPMEKVESLAEEAQPLAEEGQSLAEEAPPPVPDNLKRIKGIGPVFEARLNQAGIWTFADLAELTPEQIREIVSSGRAKNMIEPEEWIAQARQLAS